MTTIAYTYEIISTNPAMKSMMVLYRATGYPDQLVGVRIPAMGELFEPVLEAAAPIGIWLTADPDVQLVEVGQGGSFTPTPPPTPTLASVKADKLAHIAFWRFAQEVGGVTVGVTRILTDRESQATVSNAFTSLTAGLITHVDWKSASGFVSLGLPEITAIAQAVAQHVQACFTAESLLVAEVEAATTIEQVEAIEVPDIMASPA